jgi:molybdopterin-guanine dinucleotide biosynthesis protein A
MGGGRFVTAELGTFDAIIVAGGRATRLGGIDKSALRFQGRTLLQRSLDAVADARRVSVVGFGLELEQSRRVHHTEEIPRWGGPSAAIAAGVHNLRESDSDFTVVVAGDIPQVQDAVAALLNALASDSRGDGVVATDLSGRRQHLLSIYRTSSLRAVVASVDVANLPVHRLTASLQLRDVQLADELCADVDTPADAQFHGIELAALRATAHAG